MTEPSLVLFFVCLILIKEIVAAMVHKHGFDYKNAFHIGIKDVLIALAFLLGSCMLCLMLRSISVEGDFVSMVFILAVFLTARFTDGYLCGILSSFVAVLAVNYIFTFPFFRFNFTMAGYPLTILCMLGVSIATSAITTRAKQNEQMRVEAEKEKTRSNLLRAVSHDLRTPLTSIIGVISVMQENDCLPKEQRNELLENAKGDAQWLIRMVENLLTVTRMDDTGKSRIMKVKEPVEDIVSGAVVKFRRRFPEVRMMVSIPDDCLMVPVDSVLIEQVLLNLFENAVIHGRTTDEIRLTVSKCGESAVFTVCDNGKGIEQSKLEHLFDGYLLGTDETGGDQKRNMGIGLTVCKAIIDAHEGKMAAHNDSSGAVFEFRLAL